MIKAAPGNVSLETMLVEISKLEAIRAIGLPAGLFDGIDTRIIAGWRARAAVESPVHEPLLRADRDAARCLA